MGHDQGQSCLIEHAALCACMSIPADHLLVNQLWNSTSSLPIWFMVALAVFLTRMPKTASHDPKDVLPALEESLKNLELDYIDLYLMHYPAAMDPKTEGIKLLDIPYTDTWAAMEGEFLVHGGWQNRDQSGDS